MKKMKANHYKVVEKIQEQYQLIEEESQVLTVFVIFCLFSFVSSRTLDELYPYVCRINVQTYI